MTSVRTRAKRERRAGGLRVLEASEPCSPEAAGAVPQIIEALRVCCRQLVPLKWGCASNPPMHTPIRSNPSQKIQLQRCETRNLIARERLRTHLPILPIGARRGEP